MVLSGKVVKGEGYGKILGFPTANIDRRQFSRLKNKPKLGVWAGTVKLGPKNYRAGIVVGPIDKQGLPKVEAHLIGFQGNLYRKKLELRLVKYLRSFKKYSGETNLKQQINKDIKHIKQLKELWKN